MLKYYKRNNELTRSTLAKQLDCEMKITEWNRSCKCQNCGYRPLFCQCKIQNGESDAAIKAMDGKQGVF